MAEGRVRGTNVGVDFCWAYFTRLSEVYWSMDVAEGRVSFTSEGADRLLMWLKSRVRGTGVGVIFSQATSVRISKMRMAGFRYSRRRRVRWKHSNNDDDDDYSSGYSQYWSL